MDNRIPRSGWIPVLLLSAACGSSSGQTPWTAASTASNPEADGGSSSHGGIASSSGGGTGAADGGAGTGSSSGGPATASALAGSAPSGVATNGGSSGSGGAIAAPPPPAGAIVDAFTGAPAFISKVGNSPHNPGQSCMKSGCHGPGGGENPFLIGGTVYKDYKGTIPAPGVEIRVRDMAGNAASVYSGTNGNFYIGLTGSGVTFPALVAARDATTTRPMITPLKSAGVTTMGSCANAGCHIVGGTDGGPASGAYYPIHVP